MKKALALLTLLALVVAGITIATPKDAPMPKGWFAAGAAPKDYDMGLDKSVKKSGSGSAFIRSKGTPSDFGTLMQMTLPGEYLGKRVRLSADIKSQDVADWAGLWFRVDAGSDAVSFDNMQDRAIKGTSDWIRHEIVLDVPMTATAIAFGVLLDGTGAVWFDNVKFEIVASTVATTDMKKERQYPPAPRNLEFEE